MRCWILEQTDRASEEVHLSNRLRRVQLGIMERTTFTERLLHKRNSDEISTKRAKFADTRASANAPGLTGRKGQYSTLLEHVPPQHRNIDGLWSRRCFTDRARGVGPATVTVIEQILDGQAIEAQGYLSCQNPRRTRQKQPGTAGGGLPGTREPPRPSRPTRY